MIFIIKGFRTIVFIFIVISTTLRPICLLAFFRCLAKKRQDDQLTPTYSSSVRIRGIALRTCRKRWTIGRGGSGISVLMAQHDDNDDDLYLATSLHCIIQWGFFFLFSSYKEVYKCKLVNSPPVDLYAFIHPAEILFTPWRSIWTILWRPGRKW